MSEKAYHIVMHIDIPDHPVYELFFYTRHVTEVLSTELVEEVVDLIEHPDKYSESEASDIKSRVATDALEIKILRKGLNLERGDSKPTRCAKKIKAPESALRRVSLRKMTRFEAMGKSMRKNRND